MTSIPFAPRHLRENTRRWWRSVCREFVLDEHHRRLLTLLAESWDRRLEVRERIKADGAFIETRHGELRAHPGLALERQERVVFARLLRELDLDTAPPPEPPRPARVRSRR